MDRSQLISTGEWRGGREGGGVGVQEKLTNVDQKLGES